MKQAHYGPTAQNEYNDDGRKLFSRKGTKEIFRESTTGLRMDRQHRLGVDLACVIRLLTACSSSCLVLHYCESVSL